MATEDQVNLFLSDPDYLELVELEREQRLLFITDMSETRVSAFLAWMFNPSEGHGLGDQAVRELLLNAWRRNQSEELGIDLPSPMAIRSQTYRDLLVETEFQVDRTAASKGKGRGRAADLVLISRLNNLLICVENKFGTAAHSEQLAAYRIGLESEFPGFTRVLIYLDSNEENKPDDKGWIPLDYQWLIDLIMARQQSGLLSERALDALGQVKDYLSDESATSDELAKQHDQRAESVAGRHPAVMQVFREFAKQDWYARLRRPVSSEAEPLLIEYHQRWWLWDEVLAQARHAVVVALVKETLGQDLEVTSNRAEVFFRFKSWARFTSQSDGWWGPRVSAWCGQESQERYDIWAGIQFRDVVPDRETELRDAIRLMRSPGLKAAPKTAQWVKLSRVNQLEPKAAAAQVTAELLRIESTLKKLS